MVVRLSMAGLGSVSEIWSWPLHLFRAVQREYLKIVAPPKADDDNSDEIAPGVWRTKYDTREK